MRLRVTTAVMAAMAIASAVSLKGQEPARTQPAASAQVAPPSMNTARHAAALAAASRALHYCTGLFTAGMSLEQIGATDRSVAAAATMKTDIDRVTKTVAVTYAADMPPRIAAWRPTLGCAQLPIGATTEAVKYLPRLPASLQHPNFDDRPWPMGDQQATADLPAALRARVDSVVAKAFDGETYRGSTWGVVVIRDGKIVAEKYAMGFDAHMPARTQSMCKSLAATVVGVGVKKGLVDIHKKAPLAEWRRPGDPRGQITLNDMLHMASGLYTEGAGDPQPELYTGGAAAAERSAVNIMDSPPGSRFVYAGSDTILSVRAVRQAVNDDLRFWAIPFEELLWKIGMTRTTPETDWNGDFMMSGQCWSTARDFGRFGLLYINNGLWNGERILPENWAKYVSTPSPANPAYGAQFWVYGLRDGLPPDAYSPNGAAGQYAMIVPSKNVIVVRRGIDRGPGFNITKFSADVIAALEAVAHP
jgi:CubicO group peptidase (beta-lactamase class C family)